MILAGLAVVFVGIGGDDAARIDRQVGALLHRDTGAEQVKVSAADRRALARHTGESRAIARRLHADGVVAGELVTKGRSVVLRVAAYDRDGGLVDLLELPLDSAQLGKNDLAMLRTQLVPDLEALVEAGGSGDDDAPAPAPAKPPARRGKPSAPPAAAPPQADDDAPAAVSEDASDAPTSEDASESATDGASDGSATDGGDTDSASATDDASLSADADEEEPTLHMRASLSVGVVGRTFTASPAVPSYSASGVGAVGFTAEVQPTPRTALAVSTERTIGMQTTMGADAATTVVSRWSATAAYDLRRGRVVVAPVLGLGRRSFEIESADPARSPDDHYGYVIAGLSTAAAIKPWLSLSAGAAFEPVVKGAQATAMQYGTARRLGVEAWGAIEVQPHDHVFVRVAFDYQRFSWAWPSAGALANGGAVDSYPSGTLAVGATY
ncbi:MAG: hypothetical protein K8W52_08855 [Deltaproteobacteria bacterium]|nr:hypothetical protein [Deltaproteobacteria bacterium]